MACAEPEGSRHSGKRMRAPLQLPVGPPLHFGTWVLPEKPMVVIRSLSWAFELQTDTIGSWISPVGYQTTTDGT
jgi:hypothetical protein